MAPQPFGAVVVHLQKQSAPLPHCWSHSSPSEVQLAFSASNWALHFVSRHDWHAAALSE